MHVFKYLNEHKISQCYNRAVFIQQKKTTINFHKRVVENVKLQKTIINNKKNVCADEIEK